MKYFIIINVTSKLPQTVRIVYPNNYKITLKGIE